MNEAAMNICVNIFVWSMFSFILDNKCLGRKLSVYLTL